jgi:hypothetical protein
MRVSRVKAELAALAMAIESFKDKYGFYPPDTGPENKWTTDGNNQALANPLYYELSGCLINTNNNTFRDPFFQTELSSAELTTVFGRKGLVNASPNRGEVRNFIPQIRTNHVVPITLSALGQKQAYLLSVPVKGPPNVFDASGRKNFWRYRSTQPTNNPGSFDLWAEIVIRNRTNIIGNWNQ